MINYIYVEYLFVNIIEVYDKWYIIGEIRFDNVRMIILCVEVNLNFCGFYNGNGF